MIYGSNILTSKPVDWVVTDGSISEEAIVLQAGGKATTVIDLLVLQSVPEVVMISLVASNYALPYIGSIYAILRAEMPDGIVYTYNVAVVDTGGGTCIVEIPVTAVQHKKLTFTLMSSVGVTFTDWALFTPKLSDVDLTEVLDKLPRLLKDYNVSNVTIGSSEDIIAMIASYITETTELTGHLTISYNALESCRVIIRIKDNDTSELYTPMLFYLQAGYGTISIPHAYLVKLKGYHTFTVTAQVTNGTIQVDTRKVLYVIDGGRLAYSILDIGSVAYDMSVRQLITEAKVSYIYAICIDAGLCLVKKCEYLDTPGAAWISVASLGQAIDAAIEFNGSWNLQTNPYVYSTEDYPWVSWVTPDNVLKAKKLDNDNTLVELATGVLKVSMVKGWDNTFTPGNDHGLMFVYVKNDGIPYYRGWCRQLDNSFTWETERTISSFVGTAVDINAFRTNDFRVGINVMDSLGSTHTYLTDRNWSGMSASTENLSVGIDSTLTVNKIDYNDTLNEEHLTAVFDTITFESKYAGTTNSFTTISNIDDGTGNYGRYITFETAHSLKTLSANDFILTDSTGDTYDCIEIIEISLNSYHATFIDFNGADHDPKTVILLCKGLVVTNEASYRFDSFNGTFIPIGLVHPNIPVAVVEVIWNE